MVREAIEQRPCEAFRAEGLGPFLKGQVTGDQGRGALVALRDQFEEQFRAGFAQGHEAQFVDDQ